jgi:DNA polymerase III epsilon subunit-like protein
MTMIAHHHPDEPMQVPAREAIITAIDFESTGCVEGYANEPWQIGMCELREGAVGEQQFESLLRVGDRPFNPHAPGTHHLMRAEIAVAPTLRQLWPEIHPWWVGRPLVAHNIATERGFMEPMAPLHRLGPWIDTLKVSRLAYPDLESHKLEDLLELLRLADRVAALCPGRDAHDALYDAVGCAVLLEHFVTLPGWEAVTIADLAAASPTAYHQRLARSRNSFG